MSFLGHKPNGCKIVVDHINNDKLDNRVENLQVITQRQNSTKDKKGFTSSYAGVSWNKKDNRWRAAIFVNNKVKYLGSYKCELKAAEAYNSALNKLNK